MANIERSKKPGLLVIVCGLVTTLISLGVVALLAGTEFNIIGWFWLFIVPVGALLVGAVSGSGYYLGSKWLNCRIAGFFMWLVFLISIGAYVASHQIMYEIFVDTEQVSFIEYIKYMAESMSFGRVGDTDEGGAGMGKAGYLFLGLEALGYSLGAIIPVLMLSQQPYCENCSFYLKKATNTFANSTGVIGDLKKKKQEEKIELIQAAIDEVVQPSAAVFEQQVETNYSATEAAMSQFDSETKKKALAIATFALRKCPGCDTHELRLSLSNSTLNGEPHLEDLAAILKPDERGEA